MTSTEFTVGLGESSRISSKVLKPPGGGSSDIFGLGTACSSTNKLTSEDVPKSHDSASQAVVSGLKNNRNESKQNVLQNGHIGSSAQIRRNPITGEEIVPCKIESQVKNCDNEPCSIPSIPLQTSIRVRNPPGGKSSGIF